MVIAQDRHWERVSRDSRGLNESYLFVSFRRNAPRTTQARDPLRCCHVDALWRCLSAPSVPVAHWLQAFHRSTSPSLATQQPVQSRGNAPGAPLPDGLGTGADRNHTTSPP